MKFFDPMRVFFSATKTADIFNIATFFGGAAFGAYTAYNDIRTIQRDKYNGAEIKYTYTPAGFAIRVRQPNFTTQDTENPTTAPSNKLDR